MKDLGFVVSAGGGAVDSGSLSFTPYSMGLQASAECCCSLSGSG